MKFAAAVAVAGLAGGIGLGLYATLVEPRRLDVSHTRIALPHWPESLDGLRLAVIADLHIGWRHGRPWTCPALDQAVDAVAHAKPDLLLMVGDFGYMHWDPEELAATVDRFTAPARVAVMGNHDWARGERRMLRLKAALEARGIPVPINDAVSLSIRETPLTVAGLGDLHARRADVGQLVSRLPADRPPTILLSHTPDAVLAVPTAAYDLAFSGHTHGGQVALQFLRRMTLLRFAHSRFDRGQYEMGNGGSGTAPRVLYVTRGLGMVGRRVRFRSRPEVSLITISTGRRS